MNTNENIFSNTQSILILTESSKQVIRQLTVKTEGLISDTIPIMSALARNETRRKDNFNWEIFLGELPILLERTLKLFKHFNQSYHMYKEPRVGKRELTDLLLGSGLLRFDFMIWANSSTDESLYPGSSSGGIPCQLGKILHLASVFSHVDSKIYEYKRPKIVSDNTEKLDKYNYHPIAWEYSVLNNVGTGFVPFYKEVRKGDDDSNIQYADNYNSPYMYPVRTYEPDSDILLSLQSLHIKGFKDYESSMKSTVRIAECLMNIRRLLSGTNSRIIKNLNIISEAKGIDLSIANKIANFEFSLESDRTFARYLAK